MKLTMGILEEDFLVKAAVHRCLQFLTHHGTHLRASLLSLPLSYQPLTLLLEGSPVPISIPLLEHHLALYCCLAQQHSSFRRGEAD